MHLDVIFGTLRVPPSRPGDAGASIVSITHGYVNQLRNHLALKVAQLYSSISYSLTVLLRIEIVLDIIFISGRFWHEFGGEIEFQWKHR